MTYQIDGRCNHPFLHVLLIARVLRYEVGSHSGRDGRQCCQVGGDVRNGVLGEEHGSLNVLLELPIIEHRGKDKGRPHGERCVLSFEKLSLAHIRERQRRRNKYVTS